MRIQRYHIHNVLKAYSQQLACRGKKRRLPESELSAVCLSPRQKRQVIIDKVTNNIAAKMKKLGVNPSTHPLNKHTDDSSQSVNQEKVWSGADYLKSRTPIRFVYNTIDGQNRKQTCTLLIDDATFLIKP